jgi:hypothetical protein
MLQSLRFDSANVPRVGCSRARLLGHQKMQGRGWFTRVALTDTRSFGPAYDDEDWSAGAPVPPKRFAVSAAFYNFLQSFAMA